MMIDYSLKRTSDPAVEPVTIAQAKDHLRVAANVEDGVIASQIAAARQSVERDLRRSLVTQTWRLKLDCWPKETEGIILHNPPVASVTSISYVDGAGATQTWNSSLYDVFTDDEPARVCPVYGGSWPSERGDVRGITVTYVTGYGATGSAVPYELRQAIFLRLEMFYDGENDQLRDAYYRIVQGRQVGVYP